MSSDKDGKIWTWASKPVAIPEGSTSFSFKVEIDGLGSDEESEQIFEVEIEYQD